MRLLRLELTRLRWRRAVVVLAAVCLLVPVVIFAVTAWTTRPVSDGDLERAEQLVAQEVESAGFQRMVERCEKRPERFGAANAAECRPMMAPRAEWYVDRPALTFAEVHRAQGTAVIVFVVGLLMLAATTFVGADWNSGSMSNQLLFESRRWRIWSAKAGAVVVLAVIGMAVLLVAFWGSVWLLAESRGIEPVPEVVDRIQGTVGRALLLAPAAALGAYAVTMLFRSTVFTLGALFAVVIGSTVVLAALGISERWMPHTNIAAVLFDGARYYRNPPDACFMQTQPPAGIDCRDQGTVSLIDGATYLGVTLVAAVGASVLSFLRRDVP